MKLYQLFIVAIIISYGNDVDASTAKSPEQKYLWIKCAEKNNHSYLKRCSLCDGKNKDQSVSNQSELEGISVSASPSSNCSQYKRCSKCESKHDSKKCQSRTCC